jgi:secondary thiamine-phosphate synthase enzyme
MISGTTDATAFQNAGRTHHVGAIAVPCRYTHSPVELIDCTAAALPADVEAALERLVPRDDPYGHDVVDDNADAYLRAMLLGKHVTVPIVDGVLALGRWQSILFVDCDGPRTQRLHVSVVSG